MYCLTYTKSNKFCETFLYTKIQTLCKKQDKLRYVFIYKKPDTLRYAIFHQIFDIVVYILKSMTLCVTWRFYIKRSRHFAKINTICVTFLYTKILTLSVMRFFVELVKLAKGGVILKCKK